MFDTIKAIAIWGGIILVGMLIGILWHAHGGQWWVIPLCAVAAPILVVLAILVDLFLFTDWSH